MVAAALYQASQYYPKRFEPVESGKLYRSGEVTREQLQRLRDDFAISRVICCWIRTPRSHKLNATRPNHWTWSGSTCPWVAAPA
jgi:hypothetical protein